MADIFGSLFLIAGAVGLFSFLSIASWTDSRRREREAFYRSEAIKKLAEMQGPVPDSVLSLVREALTPETKPPSAVWAPGEYRRDRRLHYREEMIKKLSTLPGATAESVLAYVREDEKKVELRRREGLRLGGMITSAAGVALLVLLYYLLPDMPIYLVGLLPTLVGLALIAFAEIGKPR